LLPFRRQILKDEPYSSIVLSNFERRIAQASIEITNSFLLTPFNRDKRNNESRNSKIEQEQDQ